MKLCSQNHPRPCCDLCCLLPHAGKKPRRVIWAQRLSEKQVQDQDWECGINITNINEIGGELKPWGHSSIPGKGTHPVETNLWQLQKPLRIHFKVSEIDDKIGKAQLPAILLSNVRQCGPPLRRWGSISIPSFKKELKLKHQICAQHPCLFLALYPMDPKYLIQESPNCNWPVLKEAVLEW